MLSALVAEEEEEGGCGFVDGREPDPRRSWEDLPGVGGVTLFVMCGGRGGVPEPAAEREREREREVKREIRQYNLDTS